MKSIKFFAFLMLAGAVALFSSCGGDDDPADPPTVTVTQDVTSGYQGDVVTFTVSMSSNIDITKLTISFDPFQTAWDTTFAEETHSASVTYTYSIPMSAVDGTTHTLTFDVDDNEDNTTTKTATISITEPTAQGTAITTYTGKTIGDIAYNTTTGGYFATSSGTVYEEDAGSASNADFGFLCGNSYPSCIFSVDVSVSAIQNLSQGPGNISPQNSTKFAVTSLTAADFDGIGATLDADDLIGTTVSSPSSDYLNNVTVGDVIGFVTGAGKEGLIKVTANPSTCGTAGLSLSFDIKVQD